MLIRDLPTLGVVIPVHNMAGRLQNLEKGVVEAAEHSLPIKFTFVQDGLDRETQRELSILANKFKTESLQVNFSSPGLTRNRGIERNSSDWIAFWDSDDVGHPIECYNAILEARHSAKVLIGGFRIIDENNIVKNIHPTNNLRAVMLNPGIWRFLFKREIIGDVRFPNYAMGEDQIFLARLNLQEEDIEYFDSCFYSYFTGIKSQATLDHARVFEIKKSIDEIDKLIKSSTVAANYVYVVRARMILTALKNYVISPKRFALLFFATTHNSAKRRKSLGSFLWVLTQILKRYIR